MLPQLKVERILPGIWPNVNFWDFVLQLALLPSVSCPKSIEAMANGNSQKRHQDYTIRIVNSEPLTNRQTELKTLLLC